MQPTSVSSVNANLSNPLIPNDPLQQVFSFFSPREVASLANTCKQWNYVASTKHKTLLEVKAYAKLLEDAKATKPKKFLSVPKNQSVKIVGNTDKDIIWILNDELHFQNMTYDSDTAKITLSPGLNILGRCNDLLVLQAKGTTQHSKKIIVNLKERKLLHQFEEVTGERWKGYCLVTKENLILVSSDGKARVYSLKTFLKIEERDVFFDDNQINVLKCEIVEDTLFYHYFTNVNKKQTKVNCYNFKTKILTTIQPKDNSIAIHSFGFAINTKYIFIAHFLGVTAHPLENFTSDLNPNKPSFDVCNYQKISFATFCYSPLEANDKYLVVHAKGPKKKIDLKNSVVFDILEKPKKLWKERTTDIFLLPQHLEGDILITSSKQFSISHLPSKKVLTWTDSIFYPLTILAEGKEKRLVLSGKQSDQSNDHYYFKLVSSSYNPSVHKVTIPLSLKTAISLTTTIPSNLVAPSSILPPLSLSGTRVQRISLCTKLIRCLKKVLACLMRLFPCRR